MRKITLIISFLAAWAAANGQQLVRETVEGGPGETLTVSFYEADGRLVYHGEQVYKYNRPAPRQGDNISTQTWYGTKEVAISVHHGRAGRVTLRADQALYGYDRRQLRSDGTYTLKVLQRNSIPRVVIPVSGQFGTPLELDGTINNLNYEGWIVTCSADTGRLVSSFSVKDAETGKTVVGVDKEDVFTGDLPPEIAHAARRTGVGFSGGPLLKFFNVRHRGRYLQGAISRPWYYEVNVIEAAEGQIRSWESHRVEQEKLAAEKAGREALYALQRAAEQAAKDSADMVASMVRPYAKIWADSIGYQYEVHSHKIPQMVEQRAANLGSYDAVREEAGRILAPTVAAVEKQRAREDLRLHIQEIIKEDPKPYVKVSGVKPINDAGTLRYDYPRMATALLRIYERSDYEDVELFLADVAAKKFKK